MYEKDGMYEWAAQEEGGIIVRTLFYTLGRHAYSKNGRGRTRVKTSKSSQSVLD